MNVDQKRHDQIIKALGGTRVRIVIPLKDDEAFFGSQLGFELEPWFDPKIVVNEIAMFYLLALLLHDRANVPGGDIWSEVIVLPDGHWHVDPYQLSLARDLLPHLSPRAWVERHLLIAKG
jgi:hypothetical protein